MNLRQIEVFHAVYSVGSVSGASRLLNVSQPSVTKIIKHAETRLGFPLFKVVKGRLLPTNEAHVLFRNVDDLHARIDVFQRTAKNLRSTCDGQIRMGVLPSLAMSITPAVIARYHARYPRVTFEVTAIHHDNFRDSLVSRACDFVIGHHLLHDPEIVSTSLGVGRVGALFQRGLLPPDEDRISLPALREHEVIGFSPSVAIAGLVGAAGNVAGMGEQPSIVVRSVYIAAALARQGAGIAVVDEFTAHGFLSDELDFRLIEPEVTFELKALHLADHPLSRLARNFLDLKRGMIADRATSSSKPCLEVIGSSLN